MRFDFKIHSDDRTKSSMGAVEAQDILEATDAAVDSFKSAYPKNEVIHITIESMDMLQRRKEWERENG